MVQGDGTRSTKGVWGTYTARCMRTFLAISPGMNRSFPMHETSTTNGSNAKSSEMRVQNIHFTKGEGCLSLLSRPPHHGASKGLQ